MTELPARAQAGVRRGTVGRTPSAGIHVCMRLTLLAHGSPDPRHARDVAELVSRLEASGIEAQAAYLDHDSPSPVQAARALRLAGVRSTIVVPLLVAPAYHARVDVPAAVASMRRAVPDLAVAAAQPVGLHPLILAGAAELLDASELPRGPRVGLILAFTGSRDVRAITAIENLVLPRRAVLAEQLGVGAVRTAYLDGGRPVGRVRTLMRSVDGCTSVVAVTAMVADGVLRDRLLTSAGLADVAVAPGTLARTSALAELIALRAAAAPAPSVLDLRPAAVLRAR
jgi:sirohydrochlorin ferrochelatase